MILSFNLAIQAACARFLRANMLDAYHHARASFSWHGGAYVKQL